jgi:hypothetical protein
MVKVLLHLNASVHLRPNNSSVNPGMVPIVRLGVRCPDHPRSELVRRRCRHGRLRWACSIRCRSARRVAPPAAEVAPPSDCVGWVPTSVRVNCDGATSSACCGASRVARMSPNPIWSQPSCNIGWVDGEGISTARNWKTGGLKPPSGKIGVVGAVISGCRGPVVGKSGGRSVWLEYSINKNTQ